MGHSKMSDIILHFSLKYKGDFEKIYEAIKSKEVAEDEKVEVSLSSISHSAVTIIDSSYPNYFKDEDVSCPPFALFYKGDLTLISEDNIVKCLLLEDDTRAYVSIRPEITDTSITLSYFIGCENQDNVSMLHSHMVDKILSFVDRKELPA